MKQVWQYSDNSWGWVMGKEGSLYFSFSPFVRIREFHNKDLKGNDKKEMLHFFIFFLKEMKSLKRLEETSVCRYRGLLLGPRGCFRPAGSWWIDHYLVWMVFRKKSAMLHLCQGWSMSLFCGTQVWGAHLQATLPGSPVGAESWASFPSESWSIYSQAGCDFLTPGWTTDLYPLLSHGSNFSMLMPVI